jgi:hypothetical protein
MLNIIAGVFSEGVPPVPPSTNSYESIATVLVGSGGSSTVEFTSIPSTFKHLQIRSIARTANAAKADDIVATFNSDTGANYVQHLLVGNGSSAQSFAATGQNFIKGVAYAAGNTATSNIVGNGVLDILDYTNTNKNTTIRALAGMDLNEANTTAQMQFWSGLWLNTAAITSIQIKSNVSASISQHSQFALYGIKG